MYHAVINNLVSQLTEQQKVTYAAGAILYQIGKIIQGMYAQVGGDSKKLSHAITDIGQKIAKLSSEDVSCDEIVNQVVKHANERLDTVFSTRSPESKQLYNALKLYNAKSPQKNLECIEMLHRLELKIDSKVPISEWNPPKQQYTTDLIKLLEKLAHNVNYRIGVLSKRSEKYWIKKNHLFWQQLMNSENLPRKILIKPRVSKAKMFAKLY